MTMEDLKGADTLLAKLALETYTIWMNIYIQVKQMQQPILIFERKGEQW